MTMARMRRGFTLVELLVVIAIIGILVAMMLPAVQGVRESARRVQCANNLRQLALGCQQHLGAQGFFPTGGWAWYWSGDPDRGFGRRQPGGWTYNVLPYIEQAALHDLGKGQSLASKKAALATVAQTPLPIFYCPTRRRAITYPNFSNTVNSNPVSLAARTDYASNAGTLLNSWTPPVNGDPSFADAPGFIFPTVETDGVVYILSTVSDGLITDGLSNTFLLGEKYLNPDHWVDSQEGDDDNPIYDGFDWDSCRWGNGAPLQDRAGLSDGYNFGSAHFGGLNMAMCDGAVRRISYSIDPTTHKNLCCRNDGHPIDPSKL